MKYLYKYPQRAFPYDELVAENRRRGRSEPEYELLDTGVFDNDRYFDVFVEYAKATPEDVLCRISVVNRGDQPAPIDLLPTVWFRNTWSWGRDNGHTPPRLRRGAPIEGAVSIELQNRVLGRADAGGRGQSAAAVRGERDEQDEGLRRDGERPLRQGRHQRLRRARPARCGEPRGRRHQGLGAVSRGREPGRNVRDQAAALGRRRPTAASGSDFDRVFQARMDEADEYFASIIPVAARTTTSAP